MEETELGVRKLIEVPWTRWRSSNRDCHYEVAFGSFLNHNPSTQNRLQMSSLMVANGLCLNKFKVMQNTSMHDAHLHTKTWQHKINCDSDC